MTKPDLDRFSNLKDACGGRLNPETLGKFEIAMREYAVFMHEMRLMFYGPEPDFTLRREDNGTL